MRHKTIIYTALSSIVLLTLFAYYVGGFSNVGKAFHESLEKLHNTIRHHKEAKKTTEYVQFLMDNPQLQYKSIDKLLNRVNSLFLKMIGKYEKCKIEFDLKEQELHELTEKAKKLQTDIQHLAKLNSTFEKWKIANESAKIQFNSTKKEKRVISFSLYGNRPKYIVGAFRNVDLAKIVFPDWVCRFYVDSSVPDEVIEQLKANGAEIVEVKPEEGMTGGIAGMFWRFLVADDETVDRFIVRDVDSRLNMREKAAIDEWIKSGKKIHSLRDHPNHNYIFNGGMWGGVKGAIKDMRGKIQEWKRKKSLTNYIDDMHFLNSMVYPEIQNDFLAHDSYHCKRYANSMSFPTPRLGYEHVGQVFDENDVPRETDMAFIRKTESPLECRRKPDWKRG